MIPERFVVAFGVASDVAEVPDVPAFEIDDKNVSEAKRERAEKWKQKLARESAEEHHINFIRSREEALRKWHEYQDMIKRKYGLTVKAPYAVPGVAGSSI